MTPGEKDITFVRGDSYSLPGRVRTRVLQSGVLVPGPYRDLTGYTGLAQVRKSAKDDTVLWAFTVTIGNQSTALGSLLISSAPENTASLTALKGVWDLQLTSPQGEVFTYVSGDVNLIADVSRPVPQGDTV